MSNVKTRTEHRVVFLSPGTFVSEQSDRPIDAWDVAIAMQVAATITERHGARPFGFYFVTQEVADVEGFTVLPKEVKRSGMHFLDARVMTLEEVKREMPNERILISNMEGNGYDRIVTGPASGTGNYRWTQPFEQGDKVMHND